MDKQMSAALDKYITGNYGEDAYEEQPPCCEECLDEEYGQCPGQDKCKDVYLAGNPACCLDHKIEMTDGDCGECQADFWAVCDLDLTTAKDRVRLLKAGFTKKYPKRIEKLYLDALGIKVKTVNTKELFAFAGETYHLPVSIKMNCKYPSIFLSPNLIWD